ncbi:MAG: L-threonylcarbamoyladenylate synthase [Deltaproteobacteria bacterium]|nr:L-threonylcarbamoyladenylate synthase [Deltaproteobacteria bacterium]
MDSFIKQEQALKKAKEVLLQGGLVACPTESFYGLAVDATNEEAIRRLFALKKRAAEHPILLLIPSVDLLSEYVIRIPPVAHQLINEFWPGGLTLIFEASEKISPLLTAGTGKIGLRLSNHPLATALALIIDGGETAGGIGSTILDVTVDPPQILRNGMVQRRQLERFI